MIEIKEVKSRKDLKLFSTYPLKLYKDCPYYVPSLRADEMGTFNPKKNFSLDTCECKGFLAYKDGELVGRIVGLINHKYNETSGGKYIRFSRLECIDDLEVFKALFGAVEKYGKEKGMEVLHGPWGFNDTDREGMLTYGYEERSTYATNYYFPYFADNMKKLGFEDESKWVELLFPLPDKPYERPAKMVDKLMAKYELVDVARTMSVRQILKKYGDKMFETYNDAYSQLDGFVPVSKKVQKNVLKQFATIVNTKYISFLVDKNGDCAAFGITLPSICEALKKHNGKLFPFGFIDVLKSIRKPRQVEMALIGVKKEYKNTGINAIIITNILTNLINDKVERLESNPMLESNLNILQQWKFANTELIKKRQTYVKPLGSFITD